MIKQLFVNSAIFIASLFLLGQHFSGKPLDYYHKSKYKLVIGYAGGLIGSILIFFGIQLSSEVVLDFRYVSIIVSTIYGGHIAGITTGLIIALFRLLYAGISYSSIMGAVFALTLTTGCVIISSLKYDKRTRWVLMVVFALINSFFALYVVISQINSLIQILIPYYLSFLLLNLLVYYCSASIVQSIRYIRNLKEESAKDFLTELNNVRSFDMLYNDALKNAYEKSEKLSVVLIDLDYFKRVNDTHGHQAGDYILKQVGQILNESCRDFDIVSRNGGEEFSMLLMNCSCIKAYTIAERVRRKVEEHEFIINNNKRIKITLSLGIATYPDNAQDNESLFKNADKALYKAKETGRNKVCCYGSISPTNCCKSEKCTS